MLVARESGRKVFVSDFFPVYVQLIDAERRRGHKSPLKRLLDGEAFSKSKRGGGGILCKGIGFICYPLRSPWHRESACRKVRFF